MMECFGGGIRHTLSHKCVEDEHYGAAEARKRHISEFTHDERNCDRAEILIQRAINCGWITVRDRDQFKRNLRAALDQEVRSGGPYVEGSTVGGGTEHG